MRFNCPQPEVYFNASGSVPGFTGEYYVDYTAEYFVMVEKSGEYAVILSENGAPALKSDLEIAGVKNNGKMMFL